MTGTSPQAFVIESRSFRKKLVKFKNRISETATRIWFNSLKNLSLFPKFTL